MTVDFIYLFCQIRFPQQSAAHMGCKTAALPSTLSTPTRGWNVQTKEAFLQNSTLLDRLPQPAEPNTHVLLSGQMHSLQRASYLEKMLLVKTNEFEVLLIFSIQVIVLDTCTLRTVPSILWSDSYQCFVGCTLGKQQNKDTLNISTIWHDSAVMWFFSHISSLLNMLKWYSLYTVQITQYLNLQVG